MTKTIRRTETQPTRVGLKGATRGWEKHSEIPPPHRLHTIDSSTQPVPIMRSCSESINGSVAERDSTAMVSPSDATRGYFIVNFLFTPQNPPSLQPKQSRLDF